MDLKPTICNVCGQLRSGCCGELQVCADIMAGEQEQLDAVVMAIGYGDGTTEIGESVRQIVVERDQLRALLREVQWGVNGADWHSCPSCGVCGPTNEPHLPDCRLAAALERQ